MSVNINSGGALMRMLAAAERHLQEAEADFRGTCQQFGVHNLIYMTAQLQVQLRQTEVDFWKARLREAAARRDRFLAVAGQ